MTERYRPNTTVAWVVKSPEGFLFVEEHKRGQVLFNQPAGHIEADETIIEAAKRELYEETSLRSDPAGLVGIYQFPSNDNSVIYVRFCFYVELDAAPQLHPIDPDITACHWLTLEQLDRKLLRSPYVKQCLVDYMQGQRYPLSILTCSLIN
ncbi:NUDIX hydrolase [Echinimonas agarilytica]|uniref:Phosphatase NudJ n=1 Tax=Echinimonas agarilytica TaxID=1215918 RepID=A0AA41W7N4_9GAMM|nr:NUDIX hydrolase [Echinimonas agarilytica]MCM2680772.1 NUDIX hydrolase [Echinimonas agarilytica]